MAWVHGIIVSEFCACGSHLYVFETDKQRAENTIQKWREIHSGSRCRPCDKKRYQLSRIKLYTTRTW